MSSGSQENAIESSRGYDDCNDKKATIGIDKALKSKLDSPHITGSFRRLYRNFSIFNELNTLSIEVVLHIPPWSTLLNKATIPPFYRSQESLSYHLRICHCSLLMTPLGEIARLLATISATRLLDIYDNFHIGTPLKPFLDSMCT